MISFYPETMFISAKETLLDCVRRGLFSAGHYTRLVERLFASELGAGQLLLTPSCTSALSMACRLVPVCPGDEVILPSYNFPAAANAVLLCGGVPVLCDIDPVTQNISVEDAARRITKRTKALICVHYAAVACDMEHLSGLCREHGLALIEDAAQAVGAAYKGRYLGTFGRFGCYSFHATKVFSSGEGGGLAYGEEDARQVMLYRDNGTNRESFLRGDCPAYDWQGPGESMRMSELSAAALYPQLINREEIMKKRFAIHRAYDAAFEQAAQKGLIFPMSIPEGCKTNGHIYYVRFQNEAVRESVQKKLLLQNIPVFPHYVPLHLSPMGVSLGYRANDLPESKKAGQTLLRLPIHEEISEEQAILVAGHLLKAVEE